MTCPDGMKLRDDWYQSCKRLDWNDPEWRLEMHEERNTGYIYQKYYTEYWSHRRNCARCKQGEAALKAANKLATDG